MSTTTKAPAKKAVAKKAPGPTTIVWTPGKDAVEAQEASDGHRARKAAEAVAPSLEGPARLVNEFLEPRFIWFYGFEDGDLFVLYGARYDVHPDAPHTPAEAVYRHTDKGVGRDLPSAKRDLMLGMVNEDHDLQLRFKKPPTPRPATTSAVTQPEPDAQKAS